MSKGVYYYKPLLKDDSEIELALQEKAEYHSEEGFWKAYGRLRNEGKIGITNEYIEFIQR